MLIRSTINENRIFHSDSMQIGPRSKMRVSTSPIDIRSPYVMPELNNELQCNVGKITLYLYALKTA